MKGQDTLFSAERGTWRTPSDLMISHQEEFPNLYDVTETRNGTFDGLRDEWPRVCYLNPPYGPRLRAWLTKVRASYRERTIVALLPARTDTKWYHDDVLPTVSEIRFIRGRLKFDNAPTGAPFPSFLLVWRGGTSGPIGIRSVGKLGR